MCDSFSPPVIKCPLPSQPTNGEMLHGAIIPVGGVLDFNVVATYQCNTGYALVGDMMRTCTGDGSSTMGAFTGEQPTCEGHKLYRI